MSTWAADLFVGASAGVALGALFFGGLMWTLRRLPESRRPVLMVGVSALARVGILAVALVFVAQGRALRIGIALVAILVVRWSLVRRWAPDEPEAEGPWI